MADSPSDKEPFEIGGVALNPGERIGPFVYQRQIGSGGMARVVLAHNPEGLPVALKVLRRSRFKTGLARFRREFHALSRLTHPNVIRVESYGDLHGHPYIAMEFVDGPDLHTVIRGFKDWDDGRRFRRCEEILIDLCRALAAIHKRGLVHRDLKPSNVLLTAEGVCKLTDFGIVKDLDPSRDPHLSTTLVGTWAYTSPEHISGRPVDHRSDLYSLGVILFAMLTGKRPFVAENMAGYLALHRDKPAPAPSDVRPGVPTQLDEICRRLLQKKPKDRFQSAQEILYRLEADPAVHEPDGEGWQPPLVGVAVEVDTLTNAVAALTDRRGGVVRIIGDDGMGKSRLLDVVVERARMLGLPFHRHEFHADAPVFSVAVAMAKELLRELPDDSEADLPKIVLAYSEGSSLRGDTRYALYDGIKEALETVLQERPRVLVLDNLHEAHAPEIHLFRYQVRTLIAAARMPLLVVFAERPRRAEEGEEVRDDLGVPSIDLRLEPLTEIQLTGIVSSLVGVGRSAELLAHRLHQESEGNPYFATEFLRSMIAQGLIASTPNGYQLTLAPEEIAEGHLEIPPGIRQMMRGRLHGVRPDDRAILELLSISGQHTDLDDMLEVLDRDEEDVLDGLSRLLDQGLIRERRADDLLTYAVNHQKLADVVQRDLTKARRLGLHRRIAEVLEARSTHDAEAHEVIGEHYRRAGDAGKAYHHLVHAARRLVDRSLVQEAWSLCERASDVEKAASQVLPTDEFRALRRDHLGVQGSVQYNKGEWDRAEKAFSALLTLAVEADDQKAACEARLELATALRRRGRHEESLAVAKAALEASRRLHFRKGVAEALHCCAALAWSEGNLSRCEELATEGLLVAQGPQLAEQRARLLLSLTTAQATRGQLASATSGLIEAEDIFRELRMKRPRVLALANISELMTWQGDPDQARQKADEAHTVASELDYTLGRAASLRARGVAQLELGRYGEAQTDLHEALRLALEIDLNEEVLACRVALTQLSIERGDLTGALRHGAGGLEAAERRDPERYLPLLQSHLARALASSRPSAAMSLLRAVEESLPDLHLPRRTQASLAGAWGYMALGQVDAAKTHAEAVIQAAGARGFRLLNVEARAILAGATVGDERARHQKIGSDLARDFTDSLPLETGEVVKRRPFFKHLTR